MNYVRPNNLNLKYQRCAPLGCKDKEIRKFELVAKTQFLSGKLGEEYLLMVCNAIKRW